MRNQISEVRPAVLLVEDDNVTRMTARRILEKAGYSVTEALDGIDAMEKVSERYSLALIDIKMPRASGHQALHYIKKNYPEIEAIMLSGAENSDDIVSVIKDGAFWYLKKPMDPSELLEIMQKALNHRKINIKNSELRSVNQTGFKQADYVGESVVFRQLLDQAETVASFDSSILIEGQSGTGKTSLARLIHDWSPRRTGPFISVNCSAIPHDLLEAELFGFEKGAFTGATQSKAGRFEIADGGTIFLDEIGDLPLSLQPKILTFLQDRVLRRIGSNKEKEIDVRIITATFQELETLCERKQFRKDLYYRLKVISLLAPPLKERVEDIPVLVSSILKELRKRWQRPDLTIFPKALDFLKSYEWPGNIRELQNVIERAATFCSAGSISINDLESCFDSRAKVKKQITEIVTLAGKSMQEIERMALLETLKHTRGNKAKAARMLEISEKSIYNKIKRYDLELLN